MKKLYLLIASLLLLTACSKDDTNGADNDQPGYHQWGFYLTDKNTGQTLINDSLAPYHPDSLRYRYYNWDWKKLILHSVPTGEYAVGTWHEIPRVQSTTPFPVDTIPAYIYLNRQDIDTLLIVRWRNKEFRATEEKISFYYQGLQVIPVDTFPWENKAIHPSILEQNHFLLLKKQ